MLFACAVLYKHGYRHKTFLLCSVPIRVSGDTFNKTDLLRWLVPFIVK